MPAEPRLGLLLDVDGPLASTRTRSLRLLSIPRDLAAIANAGCPVVFNTGRAVGFLREHVIAQLQRAGLCPDAPVWGVAEKGAVWFSVRSGRPLPARVDTALALPPALAEDYSELVFWDDSKLTMASLEQLVTVDNGRFLARQPEIEARLRAAVVAADLGEEFHTAPSSISIDVEHRRAGKALGAQRALELLRGAATPVPQRWYTAGDSASDYAMADWLHERGLEVSHLDVQRGEAAAVPEYTVWRERPGVGEDASAGPAEDDITAAYLARWRAEATG